jgi:hypothetical protein
MACFDNCWFCPPNPDRFYFVVIASNGCGRHVPVVIRPSVLAAGADVAAIRAVYQQRGEFSAAVELRRRFPGITDNVQARVSARTIASWKPLAAALPLRRVRLYLKKSCIPRRVDSRASQPRAVLAAWFVARETGGVVTHRFPKQKEATRPAGHSTAAAQISVAFGSGPI